MEKYSGILHRLNMHPRYGLELTRKIVHNSTDKECRGCAHCSCNTGQHIHKRSKNWIIIYRCSNCNKTYSEFHDTIFYNSKIPLQKWCALLIEIYGSSWRFSISNLWKKLDLNYKTVQQMTSKIDLLIKESIDINVILGKILELDKTIFSWK